jgi:starch-binding outer membrane protein, SusD/RagB family
LVYNLTTDINTDMKINKVYTTIMISAMLILGACDSVLDVEPPFQKVGSQIFKNLTDYEYSLTGTYALFRQVGYFGSGGQTTSTWGNLPDMMGDNLVRTVEDLANWRTQVDWTYATDENDIQVAWLAAYSVILQANLTLRDIDRFSATDAQAVNRVKGQALAIRAMVHFDLLRYWGESFDRNSTANGIPYLELVNKDYLPARLTVAQTYDKIFADIDEAETLLADVDVSINGGTTRYYIDLTVLQAIAARVNLYAKDYAAAETYATAVITARPLASRTVFPNIWTDVSNTEVVWSVAFNLTEGSPSAGVHIAGNNRNRFKPSPALEATYDQVNDVRFSSYFATRSLSGNPRRILSKFYARNAAPPTAGDNLVNWKAIRTGEMYLIRAEARAMLGGASEALGLADLNALRAARISGYVAEVLVGQPLLDAIALERRKELVGEGHHFFDLKRTTKTVTRQAGDGHLGVTPLTLAPTSRSWNWPIPKLETDNNVVISSQQTTGY